jgi:hypothetical protein
MPQGTGVPQCLAVLLMVGRAVEFMLRLIPSLRDAVFSPIAPEMETVANAPAVMEATVVVATSQAACHGLHPVFSSETQPVTVEEVLLVMLVVRACQ